MGLLDDQDVPRFVQINDSSHANRVRKEKCAYCSQMLLPDAMSPNAYMYHYDGRCMTDGAPELDE